MLGDVEIRLRIVEALTRTDGTLARNDPKLFSQRVAEIERFVLQGNEPKADAPPAKPEKAKSAKRTAETEKSASFMD